MHRRKLKEFKKAKEEVKDAHHAGQQILSVGKKKQTKSRAEKKKEADAKKPRPVVLPGIAKLKMKKRTPASVAVINKVIASSVQFNPPSLLNTAL